jgi:hypothetical protein
MSGRTASLTPSKTQLDTSSSVPQSPAVPRDLSDIGFDVDFPWQTAPGFELDRFAKMMATHFQALNQLVRKPRTEQSILQEQLMLLGEVDLGLLNAIHILESHLLKSFKHREECSPSSESPQIHHGNESTTNLAQLDSLVEEHDLEDWAWNSQPQLVAEGITSQSPMRSQRKSCFRLSPRASTSPGTRLRELAYLLGLRRSVHILEKVKANGSLEWMRTDISEFTASLYPQAPECLPECLTDLFSEEHHDAR